MTDDDQRLRRTISLWEWFRGTRPRTVDGDRTPPICPAAELARQIRAIMQERPRQEDPMAKEREQGRRWFVPFPGVAGDVAVREPDRGDWLVEQMPAWALEPVIGRGERIARWYAVDEAPAGGAGKDIIIARTRTGSVLSIFRTDQGAEIHNGRRPEVEE